MLNITVYDAKRTPLFGTERCNAHPLIVFKSENVHTHWILFYLFFSTILTYDGTLPSQDIQMKRLTDDVLLVSMRNNYFLVHHHLRLHI